MSSSHRLLKAIRLLHLYVGVFTAPALVFFAITGGLQTFSFHETTRGSSYKPPQILVELGQLHKKQTLVVPKKTAPPESSPERPAHDKAAAPKPGDAAAAPAPQIPPAKQKNLIPMKIFFVCIAFSLLTSTLTGIYMSYKYIRNRLLITACLLGGIVVPAVLLLV